MASLNKQPITERDIPKLYFSAQFPGENLSRSGLERVARGVYIEPPDAAAPPWEGERERYLARIFGVAVTRKAPAIISHFSAAALWGWSIPENCCVHLSYLRRKTSHVTPGITRHHPKISNQDITEIVDIPVTTPIRTLMDCLPLLDWRDGLIMADQAIQWLGGVSPFHSDAYARHREVIAEIKAALHSRRGAKRSRLILDYADGRSQSPGETRMRTLAYELGLPHPVVQFPQEVAGKNYFMDLGWNLNGRIIGAEYDGRSKYADDYREHVTEKAREIDLSSSGVTIVRFQHQDLHQRSLPAKLLRRLRNEAGIPALELPRGFEKLQIA